MQPGPGFSRALARTPQNAVQHPEGVAGFVVEAAIREAGFSCDGGRQGVARHFFIRLAIFTNDSGIIPEKSGKGLRLLDKTAISGMIPENIIERAPGAGKVGKARQMPMTAATKLSHARWDSLGHVGRAGSQSVALGTRTDGPWPSSRLP